MYDKVQMGIKGRATIELKDPITDKVVERVSQYNTISEWIAKAHEGQIRSQAYQGSDVVFKNWFKTLILSSTPLVINYNTKNINLYKPDENGTYLKTYDNHPNVVGYCINLTSTLATSAKAGIYDSVISDAGRFINSTRRVFDFPASKANGTINSVFLTGIADPFTDPIAFRSESCNIILPTITNNITTSNNVVIGKLSNNNYIIASNNESNKIFELNPNTGMLINTYTMPVATTANKLAVLNNKLFYFFSENSTNSIITIKQSNIGLDMLFDTGTDITIQKISENWYGFKNIISDGSYLYSIHSDESNHFFIARIDNTLLNVAYFNYTSNIINWDFQRWTIDPFDNTLQINNLTYYNSYAGYQFIKYRITPSGTNEYLNIFTNSEQLGYFDDVYRSGIFKYNNKYYSGDFKIEFFPNNFGSMLNLDTPIVKDDQHSMTVTYDYTIL
jgi:hypothetical protein